jgi:hypothetical protein
MLAVAASVRAQEDWYDEVVRQLAHLMPGVEAVPVETRYDKDYHVALRASRSGVQVTIWDKLNPSGLNEMLAALPETTFLALGPAPVTYPSSTHFVSCTAPATIYDLAALEKIVGVQGACEGPGPDALFKKKLVVVYTPVPVAGLEDKLRAALAFRKFA